MGKIPKLCCFKKSTKQKMFCCIDESPKSQTGLDDTGNIEVMNIKCDTFGIMQLLEEDKGFLPAYHMNKKYWISVLLDNSVELDRIKNLLQMSYDLIDKKTK